MIQHLIHNWPKPPQLGTYIVTSFYLMARIEPFFFQTPYFKIVLTERGCGENMFSIRQVNVVCLGKSKLWRFKSMAENVIKCLKLFSFGIYLTKKIWKNTTIKTQCRKHSKLTKLTLLKIIQCLNSPHSCFKVAKTFTNSLRSN